MVACFVGICVLYSLEFVYRAFRDSTAGNTPLLPSWRAHMGSVCVGMAAFVIVFFFLQSFEGKPRPIAWRAASSWLSLVALTAFATAVHIPRYAVVLGGCRLRLVGVPAHASGHSNFDLTLSEAEFAVAFAAILNCVTIYPPPPIKPSRSQRTSPQQPVTRRPEQ